MIGRPRQHGKYNGYSTLCNEEPLSPRKDIQAWIVAYLADLLDMEPDAVETDVPFDSYGLDSSAAIAMTGDLEEWLDSEVDPTFIYDYPTVTALSQHLEDLARAQ